MIVGNIFAVVEVTHRERLRRHEIRKGAGEFAFRTCKEQGEWAELCFMARARPLFLMRVFFTEHHSQRKANHRDDDISLIARNGLLEGLEESNSLSAGGS